MRKITLCRVDFCISVIHVHLGLPTTQKSTPHNVILTIVSLRSVHSKVGFYSKKANKCLLRNPQRKVNTAFIHLAQCAVQREGLKFNTYFTQAKRNHLKAISDDRMVQEESEKKDKRSVIKVKEGKGDLQMQLRNLLG